MVAVFFILKKKKNISHKIHPNKKKNCL